MKDLLATQSVDLALGDLLKKREELDRQISEFKQKERQTVIKKVRELIMEFGLSKSEVFSGIKPGKATGGAVKKPKYRNPDTGQTWTGRGKEPGWVVGKRDEFRIQD